MPDAGRVLPPLFDALHSTLVARPPFLDFARQKKTLPAGIACTLSTVNAFDPGQSRTQSLPDSATSARLHVTSKPYNDMATPTSLVLTECCSSLMDRTSLEEAKHLNPNCALALTQRRAAERNGAHEQSRQQATRTCPRKACHHISTLGMAAKPCVR